LTPITQQPTLALLEPEIRKSGIGPATPVLNINESTNQRAAPMAEIRMECANGQFRTLFGLGRIGDRADGYFFGDRRLDWDLTAGFRSGVASDSNSASSFLSTSYCFWRRSYDASVFVQTRVCGDPARYVTCVTSRLCLSICWWRCWRR